MGEEQRYDRGKMELQMELAAMRNPYLEQEYPRRKGNVSRTKKRRKRRKIMLFQGAACLVLGVAFFVWILWLFISGGEERETAAKVLGEKSGAHALISAQKPDWTVDYLTPNPNSRPGEELPEVTNIFVHYTANPGTSAAQNRSYFEQLKDTHENSASAHFIIGYEGEIIQCIPLNEIAYAVKSRNYDSISIECCYISQDGSFTEETEESLVALLAYLLKLYGLDEEDILRHYDCGGKKCPLYYVEHEDAWEDLKEKVAKRMEELSREEKMQYWT